MQHNDIIFDLISAEHSRQKKNINLIASENYVSDGILQALGSVLTNKYAEGYPYKRLYAGCDIIDKIETIAIDRAKKLFNVKYVNVQPHCGSQANAAVFNAILEPGDKILSLSFLSGGHITHGTNANFSGRLYNHYHYDVDINTGVINMNTVDDIARQVKPQLIICGASAYSRDFDYKSFREIADKYNAILMADIAHTAGLITCKQLNDPFEYCHVVTATTHKTLRGPRGGIILIRHDSELKQKTQKLHHKTKMLSDIINASVFPGVQGGPHMNIIAAKAVCFNEALTKKYKDYIINVIDNAKTLAKELMMKGYKIISNGTDNHMFLIDLTNQKISGCECEHILQDVGIIVNKNVIPFDTKSYLITSGIRIGSPAITTLGFKKQHCKEIVKLIDKAIKNRNNDKILQDIKSYIKTTLCK